MNDNLAYQEERREEIIGGKVVMMSPRPSFNHNQVSYNISRLFGNYLYEKKCTPIADGMDLYLDEDNQFVPDFMVVCDPDKIKSDGVHGAPDLVVEVLSPSTARNDRTHKKETYANCGVREYWIIHPEDTGLSALKKSLWRSTGLTGQNLSSMIFTPFIPTGSLPRCPRKSGLLW